MKLILFLKGRLHNFFRFDQCYFNIKTNSFYLNGIHWFWLYFMEYYIERKNGVNNATASSMCALECISNENDGEKIEAKRILNRQPQFSFEHGIFLLIHFDVYLKSKSCSVIWYMVYSFPICLGEIKRTARVSSQSASIQADTSKPGGIHLQD